MLMIQRSLRYACLSMLDIGNKKIAQNIILSAF